MVDTAIMSIAHNPTWTLGGFRLEAVNLFGRDEGRDFRHADDVGHDKIAGLDRGERA